MKLQAGKVKKASRSAESVPAGFLPEARIPFVKRCLERSIQAAPHSCRKKKVLKPSRIPSMKSSNRSRKVSRHVRDP
jgi:hypothetical protein